MSSFKKAAFFTAFVSILLIALELLLDVQTALAGLFIMGLAGGILIGEVMAKDSKPKEDEAGAPPMRSQDYSELEDWPGYFQSVLGKGPRETLTAALDSFAQEGITGGLGVDIAAGEGRDSLELLKQGWQVVATDNHPDAFPLLWSRVPEALKPRLTTVEVDFAEMQVPDCELVNASFALPFCCQEDFPGLWSRIVAAIRPGGRFAGQFFGDRDTWASLPGRTHHSRDEVLKLLKGFEIEMMNEEEKDDPPDLRSPKHWQIFHVVAKKR